MRRLACLWLVPVAAVVLGARLWAQDAGDDRAIDRRLDEKTVSFVFAEQPAMEAINFLATLGGVNVVADAERFQKADRTVTLKLTNVPLRTALTQLADELGLSFGVARDVVFIDEEPAVRRAQDAAFYAPPADRQTDADRKVRRKLDETIVSFTFNKQPVLEALDFLQTLGNVNIVPDRAGGRKWNQKLSLKLTNVSLETALMLVAWRLDLACAIRDGTVFISDDATAAAFAKPPEPPDRARETEDDRRVRERLEKTTVSFTFNQQPVSEAFDFLRTLGNVNIVPDRRKLTDPKRTLTLKLTNVPLATALTLTAEQLDLRYAIAGGVVFVSDKAGAKKWFAEAGDIPMHDVDRNSRVAQAIRKRLRETKVSFTFHEQPVMEALDFLQTLGNVSMVIDRQAMKDPDQTVTLKLQTVPLSTGLKLLAGQLGLSCVIRDGRVLITDEKDVKRP